ncbi:MAG TPA: tRNA (adenosine(37)-N6)-dimethylallyltransferase MiaA [Candidatus Babeliales bacterium]|nr:tRNA (adenosine(37)-N6)-dimethylallyltransferase MiaA [Candidatus Babeliales bacterium]
MKKQIIIIFGQTGVGKTDFADLLAQQIPSEIINMDVGQFYTPLTIGTAKPDWKHASVPYHMFDILDSPTDYTVMMYRKRLLELMHTIWQAGKVPIIVGGSGFYLKSIFFPPHAPSGATMREVVPEWFENKSLQELWQELFMIDPVRAETIEKHDRYRIERALTIWKTSNIKPSEYRTPYQPPADFTLLFLTRDRSELYTRIDNRVIGMMEQGFLDEVRSLRGTAWEQFLLQKKLIGYNELLDYFSGDETEERLRQAIVRMQSRSRQYAKRQHTFWNMLQRQFDMVKTENQEHQVAAHIESVNLTLLNINLYITLLRRRVLHS